ncbi:uncharacterized protein LOC125290040 [Alosa alosa]|uniref:uncharacterized protein LOC125290040 n=1 Tax=Alosa alosa TaxID=278164 RepID=UPI0020152A1A|nr:uncharacterized protein LOC125290040 [Alosa alosa]
MLLSRLAGSRVASTAKDSPSLSGGTPGSVDVAPPSLRTKPHRPGQSTPAPPQPDTLRPQAVSLPIFGVPPPAAFSRSCALLHPARSTLSHPRRSNNATGCTAQDKASESHQLSPAPVPQKRQAPGRPAPPHQHTGQAPPRQHTEQAPPRQQTGQAPPHQHTGQVDVDGKAPHKLKQDYQPHPWEPSITKDLPSPHTLKLSLVKPDTVCVTWKHNEEVTDDTKFRITWTSKSNNQEYHEVQVPKVTIKDLVATVEYEFKVAYLSADRRRCSPYVSKTISTGVPAPEKLLVDSVTATSANVSWSLADKMRQRPHRFLIYYWSEDDDPEAISTESYTTDITGLTPETEYHLSISTVLHGEPSKAVETHFFTDDVSNSQLTGALPESKQTTLSRVWTFYTVAPGKAQNIVQHISKWLKERHMKEEESPEECDFILAVCPIVSDLPQTLRQF